MVEILNQKWINEDKVEYFNIFDFISKIKLSDKVLYHVEDTSQEFEKYLKTLVSYCDEDDTAIILYWLDNAITELKMSSEIENHQFKSVDLVKNNLFFDKLSINHERIKKIHKFVCENSDTNVTRKGEYRKTEVSVGTYFKDEYQPYWFAPYAKDIKKFMDDYIEFYKTKSIKELYNNPFLKSALAHLLFVRIHPFQDGNGRTARIIQNISFTSGINKIYNTKLKLSPLNISQSIERNRYSYNDPINQIKFDPKTDNNEMINKWLNYILNMYDEQLYFHEQRIPRIEEAFKNIKRMKEYDSIDNEPYEKEAKKSNIIKIKTLK